MSTKTTPIVSIVIPSYNQGQFIENTIQSILNQSYKNVEVIVVDNNSNDGTLEVLKRYKSHIRYISERDKGQSEAINKGFKMAKGEIITWLNSDDLYPDRRAINVMVKEFIKCPEYDLIYGNFIEIDEANNVIKIYRRPDYSHKRLLRIGYISQPATFFRRRVVNSMSVRDDLHYAMDLEYWLRAHRLNFMFKHINFLVAAERLHVSAKCVGKRHEMIAEANSVRLDYGARFNRIHSVTRFTDRLLLYLLRLPGIFDLSYYRGNPNYLTIPLNFDNSILRTLLFQL